jgi:CubicO group peptidase (beta-lactamase class C family)
MKSLIFFAAVPLAALVACASPRQARVVAAPPTPIKYVAPEVGLNNSGLDTALAGKLDKIVKTAIEEAVAPGVAIAVGRNGHIAYMKGYGYIDWNQPGSPAVDTNTLYDLASLTKVIATTTLAMILEEAGQLDINRTVVSYLPEFNSPEKAQITVKHLLTHSGGHLQHCARPGPVPLSDQRAPARVHSGLEHDLQRLGHDPPAAGDGENHRQDARRPRS